MHVEQLYTHCLAHAAYYIESDGEAAIIDPLREKEPYLELLEQRGAKLKYVLETHFHADFVSGHLDLAKATGATIIYGPNAEPAYNIHVATDGETFALGKVQIKVLHTPGHTPESSCYLLLDESAQSNAVFTGDTLFVGDVGRPDLAVSGNISQNDLASWLYDSLENKIKTLPANVIVYPGHGAGSACGKNIGKETTSTIGEQLQTNYALRQPSREAFVAAVTEGLAPPPRYFFHSAKTNKQGYEDIAEVIARNSKPLSINELEKTITEGTVVLDAREPETFALAYIPGSINIGLNGQYAPWVGALLDFERPIALVAEPGKEQEAVLRLARVGYENVVGFLSGGITAWKAAGKPVATIESISAEEFAEKVKAGEGKVIDVRKEGEWSAGVLPNALLITLQDIETNVAQLDPQQKYLIHCAGGYRSMIAASILRRKGFDKVVNVQGGMAAILKTPLAAEVRSPETLLA